MKLRREVLLTLTASLVAMAVIIMPVLAEDRFGVITSVDVKKKKVGFQTPLGEKLEFAITKSTEIVNGKSEKVGLDAVDKTVSQAIDAGKRGAFARVTYEKEVVSRIVIGIPEVKKAKEKEKAKEKATEKAK
jgi:hypothetical protein